MEVLKIAFNIQSVCKLMRLFLVLVLSLCNPLDILHSQHILILMSHAVANQSPRQCSPCFYLGQRISVFRECSFKKIFTHQQGQVFLGNYDQASILLSGLTLRISTQWASIISLTLRHHRAKIWHLQHSSAMWPSRTCAACLHLCGKPAALARH